MLEFIYKSYGINLKDSKGELRNVVDVLEDIYLKLNTADIIKLMETIRVAELESDIFDELRGRKYLEV
jgi:hypothetical protein